MARIYLDDGRMVVGTVDRIEYEPGEAPWVDPSVRQTFPAQGRFQITKPPITFPARDSWTFNTPLPTNLAVGSTVVVETIVHDRIEKKESDMRVLAQRLGVTYVPNIKYSE